MNIMCKHAPHAPMSSVASSAPTHVTSPYPQCGQGFAMCGMLFPCDGLSRRLQVSAKHVAFHESGQLRHFTPHLVELRLVPRRRALEFEFVARLEVVGMLALAEARQRICLVELADLVVLVQPNRGRGRAVVLDDGYRDVREAVRTDRLISILALGQRPFVVVAVEHAPLFGNVLVAK